MPSDTESLVEAAAALRRGETTSRQLVEQAIARRRDTLGAYRCVDDEQSLRQAAAADAALAAGVDLGPLMGLPVSVKDLFGVPGYRTYGGTPTALPSQWERAGPVVEAVRRQLAVIVGKTHMVELAFGGIGTNPHYAAPINPWDAQVTRVPGGSSSGAGVSLVEGSALLALGTDTAGSVRIPASYSGVVGLKTSAGRWSTRGVVPLSPTLDTVGLLASTVGDTIHAFAAVDERWRGDVAALTARLDARGTSSLRFARCDELMWRDCSPGVVEAVDAALGQLVRRGADVRRVPLPQVDAAYALFLAGGPVAIELARFVDHELPQAVATLDPNVGARLAGAASISASEYLERLDQMRRLGAQTDRALAPFDALVAPTVALTAPTLDEVASADGYRRCNQLVLRNTSSANYLGLCALTLPVGRDAAAMPVGLMLMAPSGCEERLLAVGRAIEAEIGDAVACLGRPPRLSS